MGIIARQLLNVMNTHTRLLPTVQDAECLCMREKGKRESLVLYQAADYVSALRAAFGTF